MKILSFAACLLACSLLQAQNAAFVFSPATPQPGETVAFQYNLDHGPLKAAQNPEVVAFEVVETDPVVLELTGGRKGGLLTGSFKTSPKALVVYLEVHDGEKKDNNAKLGHYLLLHDSKGKPLPQSLAAAARFHQQYGSRLGLKARRDDVLSWFETAFNQRPDLRPPYANSYASAYLATSQPDLNKQKIRDFLEEMEKSGKVPESDLAAIAQLWERRLSDVEHAKTLRTRLRTDFPKGSLAKMEARRSFSNVPDAEAYQKSLEDYNREFPAQTPEDKAFYNRALTTAMQRWASQDNWQKMEEIAQKATGTDKYNAYNQIAWDLGEKGQHLDQALQMAKEAAGYFQTQMRQPTEAPAILESPSELRERMKNMYLQTADTYAVLLAKTGLPAQAAALQKEVVTFVEGNVGEFNERYTQYLEAAGDPTLRFELERFLLNGQATDNMKDQFKRVYAAEDRSQAGLEKYLQALDKKAKEACMERLQTESLAEPAPPFSLKNLRGETVSLESLKGKVVVLDFWATWCGPCKASFPGMQMAVDQYKNDPSVAFLFVDCFESAADKTKNAADFIASKSYTFEVLLDTESQMAANYGVMGIPAKFVIDGQGRIRFSSTGFDGNSEKLAQEMSMMVEIAKSNP